MIMNQSLTIFQNDQNILLLHKRWSRVMHSFHVNDVNKLFSDLQNAKREALLAQAVRSVGSLIIEKAKPSLVYVSCEFNST